MDEDYKCPNCGDMPHKVCSITNLHLTGDPKIMSIYHCNKCNKDYLFIYLYAHLGYGDNMLLYRIDLTSEEAEELINKDNSTMP